jgi:hypothetical protein
MQPANSVIKAGVPEKATARVLAEEGRAYAIYINGGRKAELVIELPAGDYEAEWINTKTGNVDEKYAFSHAGGNHTLSSPKYVRDIALRILNTAGE